MQEKGPTRLRHEAESLDERNSKIVLSTILCRALTQDVPYGFILEWFVCEVDHLFEEPVRFREVVVEEQVRLGELEFFELELASRVDSNDVREGKKPATA
jgi:hypothetical protein